MLYLFSILYVKISHSITLTPLSIQALLVSLDLGAAFDTITHSILLCRLSASFGVSGTALLLLSSYIIGESQTTSWKFYMTTSTLNCSSGVPQGSVLGPIPFSINVSPVYHIAQSFTISHQQHANDILLYIALSASQPHSGIGLYILFTNSTINRKPYKENGMRK